MLGERKVRTLPPQGWIASSTFAAPQARAGAAAAAAGADLLTPEALGLELLGHAVQELVHEGRFRGGMVGERGTGNGHEGNDEAVHAETGKLPRGKHDRICRVAESRQNVCGDLTA